MRDIWALTEYFIILTNYGCFLYVMMVLGLLEKKDRPCLLKILLKYLQIKQYNDDFFWSG